MLVYTLALVFSVYTVYTYAVRVYVWVYVEHLFVCKYTYTHAYTVAHKRTCGVVWTAVVVSGLCGPEGGGGSIGSEGPGAVLDYKRLGRAVERETERLCRTPSATPGCRNVFVFL